MPHRARSQQRAWPHSLALTVALAACSHPGTPDAGHDAGGGTDSGIDAGPSCPSMTFWSRGTAKGANMLPGEACLHCHRGENFLGQNDGGVSAPLILYDFMGTVFDGYRDVDTCFGAPPDGVTVEILDKNGNVGATLTPFPSGNFYTGLNSGIAVPYTARVRFDGGVNTMLTAQTDGDCNGCHTVYGLNGAPGRIVWPH